MYEDLVRQLRNASVFNKGLAALLPNGSGNATAKLFDEAADAIECQRTVIRAQKAALEALRDNMQGWIPVTERLPEDDGFYMCFVEKKTKFIDIFRFDVDEGEFFVNDLGDIVTHWMPLPSTEGLNET